MKKLFEKYRELIVYVIVGGCATAVDYIIHFTLRAIGFNYYISLTGAWLGAVFLLMLLIAFLCLKAKQRVSHSLKSFHFLLVHDYSLMDLKCSFHLSL